MKTSNYIKKTVRKSFVVIVGLILSGTMINAQDSGKTLIGKDTFSQSNFALVSNSGADFANAFGKSTTKESMRLEILKVETEEKLELETWMLTDENFFKETFQFETAKEDILDLEDWMTNDQFWKVW